jgi:gamma-glutamylcyclotransferase (GGCT)/AIG2-like uncharacterized protein YtfP
MPTVEHLPVFAYGTLRPGEHNYGIVEAYVFRHEPASLDNASLYYGPGFPYLVEGGTEVRGELLYISVADWPQAIRALDYLEGIDTGNTVNGHYQRVQKFVTCVNENGELGARRAWVYMAGVHSANRARLSGALIKSGDWCNL